MSKSSALSIVALTTAVVLPLLVIAQTPPADSQPPAVVTRVCSGCHGPDRFLSSRRSRDDWQEVMGTMIDLGAKGTDDDYKAVYTFLVSHYGRVNVNRGDVDEIVEVLVISQPDAQKIVDYRKAHGPFADFDALAAVPGLDVPKLKTLAEAIAY